MNREYYARLAQLIPRTRRGLTTICLAVVPKTHPAAAQRYVNVSLKPLLALVQQNHLCVKPLAYIQGCGVEGFGQKVLKCFLGCTV